MNYDADIAVVGGGPAGLAAAIEGASRGLDIVLFEPREAPIDKACGEGLMPGALDALDVLGVERPYGVPFRGVTYRDAYDETLAAEGDFARGPGLGVRRTTLHDAMVRRLAEFDVERVDHRVENLEPGDDYVCIADRRVRWVIGADGLHSKVRREVGLQAEEAGGSRWGIRRHYRIAPWTGRVEVYWGERGEAYVTPVEDDLVGVAILFEPPGRFDDLLAEFPVLTKRLQGAAVASEDRGAGAFAVQARAPRSGRTLLVGDAAGYVDALTGEGIALGITSAREAIRAIAEGRPHTYPAHYRRVTRRWTWTTRALLSMTRPRWVHRPMIRLLRRFPWFFDRALALLT